MRERKWRVRYSARAEKDFLDIVAWTMDRFGRTKADSYQKLIRAAVKELEMGPQHSACVILMR